MERDDRPKNSDRLTYRDIGSELRGIRDSSAKPKKKSKMGKIEKAGIAAALAVTGAVAAHEVTSGVTPERVAVVSSSPEKPVVNPDFSVGSRVTVSGESVRFTGGNIRYSPGVIDPGVGGDSNLAKVEMTGATIEHPVIVDDLGDPSNGTWDKFMGSDGKTLYINHQNIEPTGSTNSTAGGEIEVTITKTTTHGVFGITADGQTVRVATAIEHK